MVHARSNFEERNLAFFFKKIGMFHMENQHVSLCLILLVLMLFSPVLSRKAEAESSARETFNEGLEALNEGDTVSAEASFARASWKKHSRHLQKKGPPPSSSPEGLRQIHF